MKKIKTQTILAIVFSILAISDLGLSMYAFYKAGHTDHEMNPLVVILGNNGLYLITGLNILFVYVMYFIFNRYSHNQYMIFFIITCCIWLFFLRVFAISAAVNAISTPPTFTEVAQTFPQIEHKLNYYFKVQLMGFALPLVLNMISFLLYSRCFISIRRL